ncbi:MAG: glucoamylase family protein [Cyclobacteriaceae bacterium]
MLKINGLVACLLGSVCLLAACSDETQPTTTQNPPPDTVASLSDEELFDKVHEQTFKYFYDYAEPTSGVARERFHADNVYPQDDKHIVTSGGGGFGVMALLVGIERGWISRQEGYDRLRLIVDFLTSADRFHGAWPHWMNGETGEVKPFSAKDNGGDLVETSFMIQGLLCVRQYFKDGDEQEQKLAADIDTLWREVEWDWYRRDGQNVLYWHWSPNFGWDMNFALTGYNECLITYVLAASSPTHGIPAEVYHEGWARGGSIVNPVKAYGYRLDLDHNGSAAYGGPLFWAHYSYLGLDPRNLKDRYTDYWEHNTNQTLINHEWCVENPNNYEGYGEDNWGLTASYSVNGYAGHRPGNDLGVITPTAALSSMPYTPDESMAAMRYFHDSLGSRIWGVAGFYDAFSEEKNFYPKRYLAIDQGPIVVMMENHRTGLLWDLFMSCPEVQEGLDKLDFTY